MSDYLPTMNAVSAGVFDSGCLVLLFMCFPTFVCGYFDAFCRFEQLVRSHMRSHVILQTKDRMIADVVNDVKAHVERTVSATMDELKELISGVLSCGPKETCVSWNLTQ